MEDGTDEDQSLEVRGQKPEVNDKTSTPSEDDSVSSILEL
jgi:hypothetical protein